MKTKTLITLATLTLMLAIFFTLSASAEMFSDSEYWQNVSDGEATALLKSTKNEKDQSFVLILYSSKCGYSGKYVPQYADYAEENGIKLYGIDAIDYPRWTEYTRYISNFVITYPVVFVYNDMKDVFSAKDKVHGLEEFKSMLTQVDYPILEKSDEHVSDFYSDVLPSHKNYLAIKLLSAKGVVKGYEDNTFKPENPITRVEAATMIVRTAELETDASASIYDDVAEDFWGKPYIMAATNKGIIAGMGNGFFAPSQNVTHNQIIKMVVCMVEADEDVDEKGGWPVGYLKAASENGIIDEETYKRLADGEGNNIATRADVAQYIYNAILKAETRTLYVDGKKFTLGMSASELDAPDEKLASTSAYTWYVYGTDTYEDFHALGVADDKIVALAASGKGFAYMGFKAGELNDGKYSHAVTDKNDENKIHGMYIALSSYNKGDNITANTLASESKMNLHFTNAFRVFHGRKILQWDDKAAKAARLHSEDMAKKDFFSHDSLDGTSFSKRMVAQGVSYYTCGENIVGGYVRGYDAYCAWVNSSGHRSNMLGGSYKYLGVGGGYNAKSEYRCYFTQDFFA